MQDLGALESAQAVRRLEVTVRWGHSELIEVAVGYSAIDDPERVGPASATVGGELRRLMLDEPPGTQLPVDHSPTTPVLQMQRSQSVSQPLVQLAEDARLRLTPKRVTRTRIGQTRGLNFLSAKTRQRDSIMKTRLIVTLLLMIMNSPVLIGATACRILVAMSGRLCGRRDRAGLDILNQIPSNHGLIFK